MSRAAVFRALADDPELNGMGIKEETIFPNWAADERPTDTGPFLILRWGETDWKRGGYRGNARIGFRRGPRVLTVWAHIPKHLATDFGDIDVILDRVGDLLVSMEHVSGGDGRSVTSISATGEGSDLSDPGYDTIVRNAAFEVLSRRIHL